MDIKKNEALSQALIFKIPDRWEIKKLEDISLDFVSGGTPSTANPKYWNGEIAWMTSAHIRGREVATGQRYITREGLANSATKIVPRNNLLVATRVGIGKAAINRIDMAISQDLTGVLIDRDKAFPEFIYWILIKHESKLKSLAQGSTIKGILREELGKLKFFLPPLIEQKKIAEVLMSVDQAIEKVEEAIEKTQRLKKGLMQELLTKGIGHKEFKKTEIGRIPKQWQVTKLQGLIKEINNGFASGKRDEKGIIQVRMNNVTTDGRLIFDSFLKFPIPKNMEEFLLKENDFLFNNTNSIDLVGKSAIFKNTGFRCTFSNHFTRIRFINEIMPEWVLFYFITLWKKGFFKSVAIRHVGQAAVQSKYLAAIKLPLPSLSEQQKISTMLTSVDKRIELLRNIKEKLEKIKKGLMEDLLTGRKRVMLES
jgi:type I restriction enzyme S subunit